MNISWKFKVKSKQTTQTFYNLSQITYLEETLQTCSRADLCSRLSWRLYTKSRAVITLSLFWALSASTWGSGPQLTSFVLHSSNLRSALSVREHGARLIGCNSKLNINTLNWLLNAHNQNMTKNVPKQLCCSNIMLNTPHCLKYIWYTQCFRIGHHCTNTSFIILLRFLNISGHNWHGQTHYSLTF